MNGVSNSVQGFIPNKIGEIKIDYNGDLTNFLLCDGTDVNENTYPELYAIITTLPNYNNVNAYIRAK